MTEKYALGIDVGGTFTDLVVLCPDGTQHFTKSPSTLEDQSIGILAGITELAEKLGLTTRQLLSQTERFVHGMTVATNALLERKGAKVALLTTEGHRDILEMREGLKPDRYNLRMQPTEPLVPRSLRFGVPERINASGQIRLPLDEAAVRSLVEKLRQQNVTSVAVCYLHAYRNAQHEIRTVELLREAMPELYISRSSEVLPKIKEFERLSTTVVNSYIGPAVQKYLDGLTRRLSDEGFEGSLFIILSHGGVVPIDQASRLAAGTVLSGPAGGIAGALRCAELLDIPNLVPFDMGGTSTDVSLIADNVASLTSDGGLAGERIALRSLDIASVGAGGGSIATIDAGGMLRVGPESAGSTPGPACYGRGGTKATVTDANLFLGYLDPTRFMGGKRHLDSEASKRVIGEVAQQLGVSDTTAAAGIFRLINQKMADGVRIVTLRRGVDPRRFALLNFGGAAGVHVAEVARELDVKRVLVPNVASVLSAWGMLQSELRYEITQTFQLTEDMDDDALRSTYQEMEKRINAEINGWFEGPTRIQRFAEMRYGEQIFDLDVDLEGIDWNSKTLKHDIEDRYHRRHEEVYTYSSPEQEVVFANARIAIVGVSTSNADVVKNEARSQHAIPGSRRAYFGEWRDTPVYQFGELAVGQDITGPALVESDTTTVVIGPGDVATVDKRGWLDIAIA